METETSPSGGGCEERERSGRWAGGTELRWWNSALPCRVRCLEPPGWGGWEPAMWQSYSCFLTAQESELSAGDQAGSGTPCREGLSSLWDLEGGERELRARVEEGEGGGLSGWLRPGEAVRCEGPGAQYPETAPPSVTPSAHLLPRSLFPSSSGGCQKPSRMRLIDFNGKQEFR